MLCALCAKKGFPECGPNCEWSRAENDVPPKPTGRLVELDLTGMLFAWSGEQPVFTHVTGDPRFMIACFTSETKLRAFYERLRRSFERIKQIEDGPEFLTSFDGHPDVGVIVDPYYTPEGRCRYVQPLVLGERK